MKVGDLVRERRKKIHDTRRQMMGVVVDFDCQGDPIVSDMKGIIGAHWGHKLEVVNEGR